MSEEAKNDASRKSASQSVGIDCASGPGAEAITQDAATTISQIGQVRKLSNFLISLFKLNSTKIKYIIIIIRKWKEFNVVVQSSRIAANV